MPEIVRIQEQFGGGVLELYKDGASSYNVPVHPSIDVSELVKDDENPMFANIEVIREGVSEGNNRVFDAHSVRQIYDLIQGQIGYFGHPDPDKHGHEFRDPQSIYVGAMLDTVETPWGETILRILAKTYVFKSSNLREWIPKAQAAGNPMTVSINALGDIETDGSYIYIKNITKLESIDWANPGTQGMSESQVLSVVSEMQKNNNNDMGGNLEMDKNTILKGVTIAELASVNPTLVSNIISNVSITELEASAPKVVAQIKEGAKITEMALKVGGEDKTIKLVDVQGIVDAKDVKITELQGTIDTAITDAAKTELETFKTQKITELVADEYREKITARVTGDTKETIEASINTEVAYITEMIGANNMSAPIGNTSRTDGGGIVNATNISGEQMGQLFGAKQPDGGAK